MITLISSRIIKAYKTKYIKDAYIEQNGSFDVEYAYETITSSICSENPFMASHFGCVEMDAVTNYRKGGHPLSFLRKYFPFWVSGVVKERIITNAGFFPTNNRLLSKYSDLIVDVAKDIDILASCVHGELLYTKNCKSFNLQSLEPFCLKSPGLHC